MFNHYPSLIPGHFNSTQWHKIAMSLEYYIKTHEDLLKKQNAGDREWQELSDIRAIMNDILMFVIPPTK